MRVQKRSLGLTSLGVMLAAVALWGAPASADISSDKPGSVVMWPKVINDGTRDTIITLTNTSNVEAYAHCEYVNAAAFCAVTEGYCTPGAEGSGGPGECPVAPGNACVPLWQTDNFDVVLTRQQPTFWRVSTGRQDNPFLPADGECDTTMGMPPLQSCPGLFPTGAILPVAPTFRGELRCVQTGPDGSLLGGNSLKGEATLVSYQEGTAAPLADTSVSTYNSINVEALDGPAVDGIVRLNGVEYSACPPAVEVSHYSSGANSLAAEIDPSVCLAGDCPVQSEITLVPCRADFENEVGAAWTTQVFYYNEFEQRNSTGGPIDCWWNFDLRDLNYNPAGALGTDFQKSSIANGGGARCIRGDFNAICNSDAQCGPGGVCGPPTGILAIVEEFHNTAASLAVPPTGTAGTAASNGYTIAAANGSLERSGRCRGAITTSCTTDSQCPSGLCRIAGNICTTDVACPGAGDFCDRCMNDEINFINITP